MINNTDNCTEIWAGTAFYQDCLEQTVSMKILRHSQFDASDYLHNQWNDVRVNYEN